LIPMRGAPVFRTLSMGSVPESCVFSDLSASTQPCFYVQKGRMFELGLLAASMFAQSEPSMVLQPSQQTQISHAWVSKFEKTLQPEELPLRDYKSNRFVLKLSSYVRYYSAIETDGLGKVLVVLQSPLPWNKYGGVGMNPDGTRKLIPPSRPTAEELKRAIPGIRFGNAPPFQDGGCGNIELIVELMTQRVLSAHCSFM
jgi:hypothetical protein